MVVADGRDGTQSGHDGPPGQILLGQALLLSPAGSF
jgi:hypothetical protein